MKKTALVTGATGAIGKAIARQILSTGKYRVVMVIKDGAKGERVMEEIRRETGMDDISNEVVDLSRKEEIRKFAASLQGPVHVLVNNAGATPRQRKETPEGIEYQWATNVLGYFWMIQAFTPHLKQAAPSRIVNVASYWAGGLDLRDPEFRQRRYNNDTAYRQSKQADRMLTAAFAERLHPDDITVNACHPGDVNSKLSNDLGFGGHQSPDQGADTPAWLATSEVVEGVSGKYFSDRREDPDPFIRDMQAVEDLYRICGNY